MGSPCCWTSIPGAVGRLGLPMDARWQCICLSPRRAVVADVPRLRRTDSAHAVLENGACGVFTACRVRSPLHLDTHSPPEKPAGDLDVRAPRDCHGLMESPLTPHPTGTTVLPRLPGAVPVLLEFEDVQLGGYSWWRDRQAPAILLLHGWGEDASTMAPVARQVLDRAWHAVSISLRGWHGSTGVDDYGLSASHDISRVLAWIRRQPEVSGIVLVGFSMGGLMAALTAADQPAGALDGVVLVNAPTELPSFAQDTAFGGVRRYLEKTLQPRQWQDSSPLHHADQLVHPLLVVVGTEDTMTPPDQGRRLAYATPASALVEVAGMGHHPTPGEWAQILEAADRQFDLAHGLATRDR